MRKKIILFYLLIIGLLIFTGCANVINIDECKPSYIYGFWSGLWHGLISPISFFGSLLSENIAFYGVNNNGGWYDFGFFIGCGSLGRLLK